MVHLTSMRQDPWFWCMLARDCSCGALPYLTLIGPVIWNALKQLLFFRHVADRKGCLLLYDLWSFKIYMSVLKRLTIHDAPNSHPGVKAAHRPCRVRVMGADEADFAKIREHSQKKMCGRQKPDIRTPHIRSGHLFSFKAMPHPVACCQRSPGHWCSQPCW